MAEALPLLSGREGSLYPPLAIILGSGGSVEVLDLLQRGWTIVAFDKGRTASPPTARLTVDGTRFEEAFLPPADLVYTAAGLPFRPPEEFAILWARIVRALQPGGWFVGHLLGEHDSCASEPDVTVLTRAQVVRLLGGFRIETLREECAKRSLTGEKRSHTFRTIARRR